MRERETMNKQEFLQKLKDELEKQKIGNADSMLDFYDEMICDRIEDGMSEDEAVASLESIEEIVEKAAMERPVTAIVKDKVIKSRENAKAKGNGGAWIVLAILGFPIWLPLLTVLLSLFAVLWIVYWVCVLCLIIIALCFPIIGVSGVLGTILGSLGYLTFPGILVSVGTAALFIGISVLLSKPFVSLLKGTWKFFVYMLSGLKRLLFGGIKR
jgi:uncharacterized membrane protein